MLSRRLCAVAVCSAVAIQASSGRAPGQTELVWQTSQVAAPGPVALEIAAGGSVLVAGGVAGGSGDAFVTKHGPSGAVAWTRTFDGLGGSDRARDIAVDANGDVYVAGVSRHPTTFSASAFLLRYDAAGNLLWSRLFAPAVVEAEAGGVVLDGSGTVLVTGVIAGAAGGIALWRFDAAGNVLSEDVANQPSVSTYLPLAGAVRIASGDVYAAAHAIVGAGQQIAIARFTASGSVAWGRAFVQSGYTHANPTGIAVDAAGAIHVSARCAQAPDPTDHDGLIVKYDAAGNFAWSGVLVGQPGLDDGYSSVAIDPEGRAIVAGAFRSGAQSLATVEKYDPSGFVWWSNTYAGLPTSIYSFEAVAVDAGGDAFAFGRAGGASDDMLLLRFDREGDARWAQRFDAGLVETGTNIALAADGTIVCVGYADGHVVTRKLDPTVRSYCYGDGSGAPCPCANTSAPYLRAGCSNSSGRAARLHDLGIASLSADSLRLVVAGLTDTIALYFQGSLQQNGGAGAAFGDGLRCAGGSVRRLVTEAVIVDFSYYPAIGQPAVSVLGAVAAPGTRTYQVWYRNAASFCTSSTFNLSNGLLVRWMP